MMWCNRRKHSTVLTNVCPLFLSLCLSDSLYSKFLSRFYFHLPFCQFFLYKAFRDRSARWKRSRNKLDITLVSLRVLCGYICVHTWGCRECSREKTAKKRRRVSAICCCTISLPMRRQMRAIRLSVLRQTAVRVCTPLGNLRTAEWAQPSRGWMTDLL